MLSPLLVSLGFYAYVFISCELIRQFSRPFFRREDSLIRRCLLEFLGSLQICACIFEGSIVGQYYGQSAYFLTVAGVIWVHSHIKRPGIHSNPSSLFEDWSIHGLIPTPTFLLLLASECAAGFVSFRVARQFWQLEYSPEHGQRFRDFICTSDLAVSIGMGMFYEGLATFIDRVVWLKAERNMEEERAIALGSIEVAVITIIGVNYTGMYFNPILASALQLGCTGQTVFEHFMVYWVGSIMGWILGTYADRWSGRLIHGDKAIDSETRDPTPYYKTAPVSSNGGQERLKSE